MQTCDLIVKEPGLQEEHSISAWYNMLIMTVRRVIWNANVNTKSTWENYSVDCIVIYVHFCGFYDLSVHDSTITNSCLCLYTLFLRIVYLNKKGFYGPLY